MSRWRSFLPDLMTVRAVMVRAALEKKKSSGHAEETVGISGWLIRGLAAFLILLQQGSLHQSDWNISSMRLP